MTCSVCIPTYRRPTELTACLGALMRQVTPPDEVVISDAAGDDETRVVIDRYREGVRGGPPWAVRHCHTVRTGLPWQRWWAFRHATGSIALFIDDDVRLEPEAVARLMATYRRLPDIAGAGFAIAYDDAGIGGPAASSRLRERWLGIAGARPGSITAGGISIELPLRAAVRHKADERHVDESAGRGRAAAASAGTNADTDTDTDSDADADTAADAGVEEVDWLSGGAMSYRREALEATGPLERLFDLYDQRIGKAEDSLLSLCVRRYGRLVMIPGLYARHPALVVATRTESPQDGFDKGLLETWGRAHVLRWLARTPADAFRAWMRVASLELARAGREALRHPAAASHWQRLGGGAVGIARTLRRWPGIPAQPNCPPEPAPRTLTHSLSR